MSLIDELKWDAAGLVTVVAQDRFTGEIRMLAHANAEAVRKTLDTGEAHFWSRSRQALWRKGESSGNVLVVHRVMVDCDRDALVYQVVPQGPSCHTGAESCFFTDGHALDDGLEEEELRRAERAPELLTLGETIAARASSTEAKSYTKSLLAKGAAKIGAKITEEAGELVQAIESETDERVVSEAADLLFHVMVGLEHRGVRLRDVAAELARRAGTSGHEEKRSRATPDD